MKVIVADGHPTVRLGLNGLLIANGIQVVGESEDGEEILKMSEDLAPDLVTLGLNLSGEADGIEVCRKMKELPNPPHVLVYSTYNFNEDVSSCLLAGADSYVHKRVCCEELLEAIRKTATGGRVWKVGERVGEPRGCFSATNGGQKLTTKEREIAVLILRRYSNTEIAEELYLSMPTVKTHVKNILRKLSLKSRWELC